MSNEFMLSMLRIKRAGLHPGWLAVLAILAFVMLGALAVLYPDPLLTVLQIVVAFGLMAWSWIQRAQLKQIDREIQRIHDGG